jgi:hypothetical protein
MPRVQITTVIEVPTFDDQTAKIIDKEQQVAIGKMQEQIEGFHTYGTAIGPTKTK